MDLFAASSLQMESKEVHLKMFDSVTRSLDTDHTNNVGGLKTRSAAITSVNEEQKYAQQRAF